MCQPAVTGYAGYELRRPQREVARLESPGHGVQFHPSHSDWIQTLRTAGFAIDALHELYAPPGATTHPYDKFATAHWAQRWPVEEIWIARLTPAHTDLPAATPQ